MIGKAGQSGLKIWLPLLLLITAVFLRLYLLADAPPGVTHDEADHSITAWNIVNGERAIYFTIGYGREPLYDYMTALVMMVLGPTYLAGRLTAVFFSLVLLVATYAWVRDAFGQLTALVTLAGLAVSFWPLMTSRQALRSELLPAFFGLALFFFWRGLKMVNAIQLRPTRAPNSSFIKQRWAAHYSLFIIAGLCLGLTFYTYIPARILWAVFPSLLLYWGWVDRDLLRRVLPGTAVMLGMALLVSWPLWQYLANHPGTEVRIDELSAPLDAAIQGEWSLLLENAWSGWQTIAGTGDESWRYNLPGRPFLPPVWAILFYAGLGWSLIQIFRPVVSRRFRANSMQNGAYFLAVAWLLAGISPVLVTGARWSVTQAIGMQPVLFLFPALMIGAGIGGNGLPVGNRTKQGMIGLAVVLITGTAVFTVRDYFGRWANAPEVRVQYEATMLAAMDYLNEYGSGATAISTITPDPLHTPAVAWMTLDNEAVQPRWFDGRASLLLPGSRQATWVLPGFTPVPVALQPYWEPAVLRASLPLRDTDLDRPLMIFEVDGTVMQSDALAQMIQLPQPVPFAETATLLGFELLTASAHPGSVLELVTMWQLEQSFPDLSIFVHMQGERDVPVAQAVKLDAPSALWQAGDWLIQYHTLQLPPETAVGDYPLAVGLCIQTTPNCGQRLSYETDDTIRDIFVLPESVNVIE